MATTDPTLTGGGVMPIGFVEPLNQWQREGLTAMTNPLSAGNGMYSLAAGGIASIPGVLEQANKAISGPELTSRVSEYFTPYLDQVLGRTTSRLNESAQQARAGLMASQGFRKAFGDTAGAVQNAEIDKNLMNSVGDATATLSYQGYNDAVDRALDTITGERNRNLNVASGLGGFSQLAGNLGGTFDNREMTNRSNLIGAGGVVQQQNQMLLDVLNPEIKGVQGYDEHRLNQLAAYLDAFKPTQYQNQFTQEDNMASRAGIALNTIGGINWDEVFG